MDIRSVTKAFVLGPSHRIYFLIQDGAIVYVGKSNNLSARISSHKKDKEFDSVRYLDVQAEDQDALEIALIKTIRPPLNLQSKSLKGITQKEIDLVGRYTLEEEILKAAVAAQPPPDRESYGYVGYYNGVDIKIGYYDGESDFSEDDHFFDCKYKSAVNALGEVSEDLDDELLEYCKCEPDAIVYFGPWSKGYSLVPRVELHDIDGDQFIPLKKKFDPTFLQGIADPELFKKIMRF